ncbi:MAG: methionine--tRNA ligase subunit beta, partial [Terriglobia bacterium]
SYSGNFDRYHLQAAVGRVWHLISLLNGYLVRRQPWKLAESGQKEDRAILTLVLYTAADLLRTVTILLYPIIPEGANKLWTQLGCGGNLEKQSLADLKWGQLKSSTKVGNAEPIFPRLDKEATLRKLHELAEEDATQELIAKEKRVESPTGQQPSTEPQAQAAPASSSVLPADQKITIDDFAKVDLRVGTILSAEPIPGATKLLKLQVDIGTEVRQVCAGIAEHYKPEDLVGLKIVLVANLQPRKLRGVESNGMVLAASVGEHGKPVLATFKEDVPNGTKLK